MSLAQLFPLILIAHIALAVTLFLPSLLLPFALRSRNAGQKPTGRMARGLMWLQGSGSLLVGTGLVATGAAMVAVLGPQLLAQPWLLLALAIYAVNLGIAFFVQRPALRRLLRLSPIVNDADRELWRLRARRQRYVSYLMAAAVGIIGFLMSTKPEF